MKKVSAFAVFKSKKGDTPTLDREDPSRGSIKKASSTPAINGEEKKTSKLLIMPPRKKYWRRSKNRKAFLEQKKEEMSVLVGENRSQSNDVSPSSQKPFKGGSFRKTIRGNKHRPTSVSDSNWNSPFVAGDSVKVELTGMKDNSTPTGPNARKESVTSPETKKTKSKQKKPLPPLPTTDIQETPKNGPKRQIEGSPDKSQTKRLRVNSPVKSVSGSSETQKVLPVQPVSPQKKEKVSNKKKVWQGVTLQHMYDSQEEANKLFECMIHPVTVDKFFKELWEKKPLLVRRHDENYNEGWFSTDEFDKILKEQNVEFGVNLDVTSYKDGVRETHNPSGRAYRPVVWDFYQTGCSLRLLNPQSFSKSVWKMLSVIQEYFGCCVGANVYLTPPGTQGFAPHYDDIEAFILQLEGKKHWKLYNPRNDSETLPRFSSGNFTDADIGSPILDITLEAGDMLYFPRGTIHQAAISTAKLDFIVKSCFLLLAQAAGQKHDILMANALEDTHSLHITFSCYQKNSWGDLLETLVPRALQIAMEEDVEFRQGLPVNFLNYMGLVNSDIESPQRDSFMQKISTLMTKLVQDYLPIDAACDQLGKKFVHDSLPPVLNEGEKLCSAHGHGEHWDPTLKSVKGVTEIEPDTMIKLIRKGALRLVTENDEVRVYHNLENTRVYHEKDPQYIDITPEMAPAVEHLVQNYPDYVAVDSLPQASVDERVEIASLLYDKGLLVTGEPLDAMYEDSDSQTEKT